MIAVFAMSFLIPPKNITIFLAGDSTMSIKDPSAYPETGWGMPFVFFWDSTVRVINMAKNGRSTSSFIAEGRWQQLLNNLHSGDYVFIQFGHNDEVHTKKTYTAPDQFKKNLIQFVLQVRVKDGLPVLLTPVARRRFDTAGHIQPSHAVYTNIIKEVANVYHVPLIDLDMQSQQLYQQWGSHTSENLFNHLIAGEHPNYPLGKADDTHFNELGARKIAEIVLKNIRNLLPDLSKRIIKPVIKN